MLPAPSSRQPSLDRNGSELKPEEKEVLEFFSNTRNVAQFIEYCSLEEKKGKDKFNRVKFLMFKHLFRNHGDSFFHIFKPHLESLVTDSQESSQRCAAEMIGGEISKNFFFRKQLLFFFANI